MGSPKKPVVLQVIPDLDAGGAERSAVEVAAALVEAGGRALVVSSGGRLVPELEAAGARFVPMPVNTKNPLTGIVNAWRLALLARAEAVDLLHVRSRAPAFSVWLASALTGLPWLATYHGIYKARSPIKRWYNAVMTRGRLTIANSAFTAEHLRREHRLHEARMVTINRGVDLDRFDPALVSKARVDALRAAWGVDPADRRVKVLLAGRLTRIKGQLPLVQAAARLAAAGRRDFLILLVGDDQGRSAYRAEVEAAVRAAGLTGAVKVLPHCADMPAAYLVADIVAVPSVVPESFGRTAVEPQAMGRPVVASDLGGMTETVLPGETGWRAVAGDPEALAKALAEALDAGPRRRAAMGRAGAERVRRLYSARAMTDATLAAYARVLGG
ncbi:MAG: glycosyltransferase family 4 protein [Caulobacteraceae bacterium]|nr:glycosyltransferase family 4 protein [Caulobacteraceae bacterium]